jgi:hypothetical protein
MKDTKPKQTAVLSLHMKKKKESKKMEQRKIRRDEMRRGEDMMGEHLNYGNMVEQKKGRQIRRKYSFLNDRKIGGDLCWYISVREIV